MTRMFQVKIGIRNIVMPGRAQAVTIVVIMLTAPRMVPRPEIDQARRSTCRRRARASSSTSLSGV